MKNRFITRKNKRKRKLKHFFLFVMFISGLVINYKIFEKSKYTITDKEFTNLIINTTFTSDKDILEKVTNKIIELSKPIKLLNKEYTKSINIIKTSKEEEKPIIYLYNTHQTEEYKPSDFIEFSINPTVIMNNYILEDIFNKNDYKTLVEEESIRDILKENNWKYVNSYKASRILLERRIVENPTLKYFIDIHRDSLPKDKTTITIEGKDYAKVVFIVGMENNNYQSNLEFTTRINNKIEEKYPGLTKGIYKKGGNGVNGVYNQDFSPKTILIEIGGYENNTTEVLNTSIAFSKCFLEVINEENI
ncbi:MAG: stage II sporulation protein P [Bacilli bacterium]|nr:stage II sporulation protein P [Bacilli bacterium]